MPMVPKRWYKMVTSSMPGSPHTQTPPATQGRNDPKSTRIGYRCGKLRAVESHSMPPWMMGYSMPSISVMRVLNISASLMNSGQKLFRLHKHKSCIIPYVRVKVQRKKDAQKPPRRGLCVDSISLTARYNSRSYYWHWNPSISHPINHIKYIDIPSTTSYIVNAIHFLS